MKEPSQLGRQRTMSLPQMLADLPRASDVGTERNAKGHTVSWNCINADPTIGGRQDRTDSHGRTSPLH